jgi:hypothetical protein
MTLEPVPIVIALLVGGVVGYVMAGSKRVGIECVGHAGNLGGTAPPPREAFDYVNDHGTSILKEVVGEDRRDDYILLIRPQTGTDFHFCVIRSERVQDLDRYDYDRIQKLIEERFQEYFTKDIRIGS